MNTPHKATPEQWRWVSEDACLIELRDRLAAAEQRISELEQRPIPGSVELAKELINLINVNPETQTNMDANLLKDAKRYRWIKAQKNLHLETCKTYGTPWTRAETGVQFYPSHILNVKGTGFNGIEHLDDLIDQAMEIYP